MQVSLKALESMESKAKSAMNRVKTIKAEAEGTVLAVVTSVETLGTAFSFGVINGRWGSPELLGVPVDLGTGLAMHAIGFFADDGKDHFHALGNGALCSYFSSLGAGVGRRMLEEVQKAQAQLPAQPK